MAATKHDKIDAFLRLWGGVVRPAMLYGTTGVVLWMVVMQIPVPEWLIAAWSGQWGYFFRERTQEHIEAAKKRGAEERG